MAYMYDQVLSVITQSPESRPDTLIEQLIPWFQKKSELFRSVQKDILKDIVRNCNFQLCNRDQIIIRQEEKGDRFYIILHGQVSVYFNNKLGDGEIAEEANGIPNHKPEESYAKMKPLDRRSFGTYITTLEEGNSFGEIALITEDCVRTASVITDTKTDLLVVSRELFNRCLRAAHEQEFNAKMAFVNSCEYFCNWQPKYKKQLAMSLVRRIVPFEGLIMKQGDPIEGVYFISSGQAKITMQPSLHGRQNHLPHIGGHWINNDGPEDSFRRQRRKESEKASAPPWAGVKRLTPQSRTIEVCISAKGSAIGDIEVCFSIGRYLQTAVAVEPSEVVLLTTRAYEHLLIKRYPKTADMIKSHCKLKVRRRLDRLGCTDDTQFLRCLCDDLGTGTVEKRQQQFTPGLSGFSHGKQLSQIRQEVETKLLIRERSCHKSKESAINPWETPITQSDDSVFLPADPFSSGGTGNRQSIPTFNCHNKLLRERKIKGAVDSFRDWQTSDEALSTLEMKLNSWHNDMNTKDNKKERVVRLRRFSNDDDARRPLPGQKIILSTSKTNRKVQFRHALNSA